MLLAALLWTPAGCRPAADLSAVREEVRQAYPDVPAISTADLAARLNSPSPPLLLDTRTRAEFDLSHLPGAVWADEDGRAAADPLAEAPRRRPIVVYCSVGHRSGAVARRLREEGFSDVRNLDGSIFLWSRERRPLVDAAGRPTNSVHPYNRRWGRLLADR